ncbi:MAG: hypothetical protein VKJ85_10175 [Prochlorothrix sp.]|nr:hypothetical protein [Prochlorothrix sp.]
MQISTAVPTAESGLWPAAKPPATINRGALKISLKGSSAGTSPMWTPSLSWLGEGTTAHRSNSRLWPLWDSSTAPSFRDVCKLWLL